MKFERIEKTIEPIQWQGRWYVGVRDSIEAMFGAENIREQKAVGKHDKISLAIICNGYPPKYIQEDNYIWLEKDGNLQSMHENHFKRIYKESK